VQPLFRNFGTKLVDLWRCEAGLPSGPLIAEFVGADTVFAAHERKQGVLLVTPHLGNWEVGGYALAARGIKLRVVTLAEPAEGLTELRSEAREKQGIETIVVAATLSRLFILSNCYRKARSWRFCSIARKNRSAQSWNCSGNHFARRSRRLSWLARRAAP